MTPETAATGVEAGDVSDAAELDIYTVTWRCSPRGETYLLDCDDRETALWASVALAEQGRFDVDIIGPLSIDLTPEDHARIERVRQRVMARLQAESMERLALERVAMGRIRSDAFTAIVEAAGRGDGKPTGEGR